MSAGAARCVRWQHRAPCSLLFLFVVAILLPLLIPMTQGYAGGHQEPVHVGEDPHTQSPPVDGGEHAEEEQQQLNRLGSRPPSCVRSCGACAPCKAVEVRAAGSYEPVWWKCECGGAVFDP